MPLREAFLAARRSRPHNPPKTKTNNTPCQCPSTFPQQTITTTPNNPRTTNPQIPPSTNAVVALLPASLARPVSADCSGSTESSDNGVVSSMPPRIRAALSASSSATCRRIGTPGVPAPITARLISSARNPSIPAASKRDKANAASGWLTNDLTVVMAILLAGALLMQGKLTRVGESNKGKSSRFDARRSPPQVAAPQREMGW